MRKIRVYADTSVFGGVFDDEFKKASSIFFEQVKLNLFEVFVSPIVRNEISLAPQQVQDFYSEILPQTKIMDISDEALKLRDAYLNAKIIFKKIFKRCTSRSTGNNFWMLNNSELEF